MKIQKAFQQLIENSNPSWKEKCLLAGLGILSWGMRGAVALRRWLYNVKLFQTHQLERPVVSVGNLTLGGTGKTPLVEMLARGWDARERRVTILTRGYGRRSENAGRGPEKLEINPQQPWRAQAERWGDEPLLLARQLPQATILVGKNRVESGTEAVWDHGADLILLDDGYQYLKLHRDINLVVVDGSAGFGNGRLFPRGMLREPVDQLRRASAVVMTRCESPGAAELERQIRQIHPEAPIFYCRYLPQYFEEWPSQKRMPVESLVGKPVWALSGIARPESFEQTLAQVGAIVAGASRFPDHHYFSAEEIDQVARSAREKKVFALVTTEKDAVRLPEKMPADLPVFVLKISAQCPGLLDWVDLSIH